MTSVFDADVCVVGGGPAGAVCAGLLGRAGHRVLLIKETRESQPWPELLSPEATLILAELGLRPEELESSGRPCRGILDSWLREQPEFTDFELLHCSCGWNVDRCSLAKTLQSFATENGAQLVEVSEPVTGRFHAISGEICGRRGQEPFNLRSRFVVDATGVASGLMAHAPRDRWRFDQLIAVSMTLNKPLPRDNCMLLGSSSHGWWYALPSPCDAGRAILMTDGDLIPKSPAALHSLLQQEFIEAFGRELEPCLFKSPAVFKRDARTTRKRQLCGERWMSIGDAAYSVDPIAGSGLTRALKMAQSSASAIATFLTTGNPIAPQAVALSNSQDFLKVLTDLRSCYWIAHRHLKLCQSPFWSRRVNDRAFQCAR